MSRISCVRSITRRSSRSARFRACAGAELVVEDHEIHVATGSSGSSGPGACRSRSRSSGRAAAGSARARRPPRPRPSARARAARRSSSSVSSRPRPAVITTRIARSTASTARTGRVRASSSSSARIQPLEVELELRGQGGREALDAAVPASWPGESAATWAGPGRPSSRTSMVAIASRRSFARSVRSSRVSGSPPSVVWRQRTPRRRPRPARMRPQSGITIEPASPTITWVTAPRRSTSTPTCRPISRESSVSSRANSWVTRRSGGRRRRPRRSSRCSWLAFRPFVLP